MASICKSLAVPTEQLIHGDVPTLRISAHAQEEQVGSKESVESAYFPTPGG